VRLSVLRAPERASQAAAWNNEESIREELFSIERLEQHAESLAVAKPVTVRPVTGRSLAGRVKDNESVLLRHRHRGRGRPCDHSGRRVAARQLSPRRRAGPRDPHDLPPGYYRQLPKLAAGPIASFPRVFGVAWAFVAHTDSRFDPEMLRRFVRAYRRVQPLTTGELWAVARHVSPRRGHDSRSSSSTAPRA